MENKHYNVQFWKNLCYTFGILLFGGCIVIVLRNLDKFIEYDASWQMMGKFFVLMVVSMLPVLLICSLSIAWFIAFRKSEQKSFTGVLSKSFLVLIPFIVAIWCFDNFIQWRVTAGAAQTMWNIQARGTEYMKPEAYFMNITPGTSSPAVLSHKIDSLQKAYTQEIVRNENESYDTASLLGKYRFERLKRNINTFCLIIDWLIIALLGYWSRNISLRRVFGILAIVIVCLYAIAFVTNLAAYYSDLKRTEMYEIKRIK